MPALLKITPEKVIEIPVTLFAPTSVELLLENTSHPYVAFKIKTTAPKSYLVRPSTGIIAQGQKQMVQIVLQPFTEEPPRTCLDRFLVQSTIVENNDPLPRDYWQNLKKESIQDSRLSVVFKITNRDPATTNLHSFTKRDQSPTDPSDWKSQYDQLVEYALAMERHKDELARENEALKKQLESSRHSSRGLFEVWHIPVYVFIFLMLWYIFGQSNQQK